MKFERITFVGMGAIGGLFAGQLGRLASTHGLQLSALARGETLTALQSQGLVLHQSGSSVTVPVRATQNAEDLGPQDLVVVAVKAPAMPAVAPDIARLCGPNTVVLVAMNGVPWWFFDGAKGACANLALQSVDPGGTVAKAIPAHHVIGCVVHAASRVTAPAVVQHVMGQQLIIGEPRGGTSDRVQGLQQLLVEAGFEARVSEHIQQDIWFKLWGNMTMNPVSALTGATADRILDDPLVRQFCSSVMREAQAIGQRIGCPIDQSPDDRHAVTRKLGAFKTSMLQDLEASRPLELDALVGAVQEIGRHLAIPTPQIDALMGLSRLLGQSKGLYPIVTR